jgi:transcriptional regulator GlxA family with amidase domain
VQLALALFPGFTCLDIIGPFQVLADVPGHETVFVAAEPGLVPDHTGLCPMTATKPLTDVSSPDVIVVPGGNTWELDKRLVDWVRDVHPTTQWTTSVCTGSLYLAAAGLLEGLEATGHWAWATQLNELGARYVERRVVENGKVITAAGVSSGIDMALTLLNRMYGPELAQGVQLGIEYDPQPPFDTGSVSKAGPDIVEFVRPLVGPDKWGALAAQSGD